MRINDRINATEVRLISSSGDQVGVVTKSKALEINSVKRPGSTLWGQ